GAHARVEGLEVDAIAAAQERAVDIEEIGALLVPAEAVAYEDAALLNSCGGRGLRRWRIHLWFVLAPRLKQGRALQRGDLLARRPSCFKNRTFATRRTLEINANLRGIEVEFGHGAAEGIAVHTELFCSFTLVTLVMGKHFHEEALFEFAHGFSIGNSAGVHL